MARKMNFPGILADGEAKAPPDDGSGYPMMPGEKAPDRRPPYGFRAQTVNGTAHCEGTGWNRDYDWNMPEVREGGAWQKNGNRTGE